ncbi:MAG: TetR/AcrR family transcriptional regulator [Eubacteriales bacterium]|nr:TetR/AcrR family transcriptional regulator [Eubacteriales bacterium]
MAKNKPKNDYRVILTRKMFRQALTTLLIKNTLQSITIKELCDVAGVNRGTFYSHYADIYDLMDSIEKEMLVELKRTIEEFQVNNEKNRGGSPFSIYFFIFNFFLKNTDMCTILLGENSDRRFVTQLLDMGQEMCIQIYSPKYPKASEKDITMFYNFIASGCIGLLQYWINNGMTMPVDEISVVIENIISGAERFFKK